MNIDDESLMDINIKLHNIIRDLNKHIESQQKDIAEKDKKIQFLIKYMKEIEAELFQ